MKESEQGRKMSIEIARYQSPVGDMSIGSWGGKICLCDWTHQRQRQRIDHRICGFLGAEYAEGMSEAARCAIAQLEEYFAGTRREFCIPITFTGSAFQCMVWEELLKISYGTTVTYAELARRIGNPRAVRAVASAVATNPMSLLVPCHRVTGSDGSLTGYAGGMDAKRYLLDLEQEVSARAEQPVD